MLNTKAKSAAKMTSRINDLRTVKRSDIVPFPIDWNMLPARTPKGMKNIKKPKILNASTILGARIELSAEYENMNDNGSAKIKKNAHIMRDEIIPNLTP